MELDERLNIAQRFLTARLEEGGGDRVALRLENGDLSYADVEAMASRAAHLLRDLGVRREERVFIALPDGPEFVAALFGSFKLGAVAVMINPSLKPERLAALFDYCLPRLAVLDAGLLASWEEARGRTEAPPDLLVVGGDAGAHASWDALLPQADEAFPAVPTHPDDPALWLFSGGTTGLPKAVVQTHRSYANTTELYGRRTLGLTAEDITLSVPKLYFGYATGCNLFFPFSVGASAALYAEPPSAEVLFEHIARHRPTVLVNVPSMVQQMVNHPAAQEQDLSCLRFATSAGEALPVPLYERWKETFGVELLDGLGTAEMWHIFLTNRPGDVRPGTLGRPVEGFDVRVRDEQGHDLPVGETGELWVRGDSQALGYWRNLETSKRVFRGDWVVTGDLVTRDAEGYFHYRGRGDDVLKVKGKWLAPQEVESCLARHPQVVECAVVGVEDDEGLTKPIAFVVPRGATDGLEETLKAHVLAHLQPYKHPRRVILLDEFPRTHLGKIDRRALKDLAVARP
ncbi:MAG: benzoate-CoA ligase family protein [Thermoanaerobaculia bacterium]